MTHADYAYRQDENDPEFHVYSCACGEDHGVEGHTYDSDGVCTKCGYGCEHTIVCTDLYHCTKCQAELTQDQVDGLIYTDYCTHTGYTWKVSEWDNCWHEYICACGWSVPKDGDHCRLCGDSDATTCYLCGASL